jgi:ribose 5-phosphate isomerase
MMELSPMSQAVLSQDELKTQVALAALHYVVPNEWVGVGTGSTVNKFIESVKHVSTVEKKPELEGKLLTTFLTSTAKK